MTLHVFNHHDGVIDHEPDRKHQAEERERVDREAKKPDPAPPVKKEG